MSRNALSFEHELWMIKFKLIVALNLIIPKRISSNNSMLVGSYLIYFFKHVLLGKTSRLYPIRRLTWPPFWEFISSPRSYIGWSRSQIGFDQKIWVRDQTFLWRRHCGYIYSLFTRLKHGREIVCEMNAMWCDVFSKYLTLLCLLFFISESEKVIENKVPISSSDDLSNYSLIIACIQTPPFQIFSEGRGGGGASVQRLINNSKVVIKHLS